MVQFSWVFDAPTGTYKSHELSQREFIQAVENSVMMDHVQTLEGFGRKQGETVTMIRIANIAEPTSLDLTEGVRIPEDEFSISTTAVTVNEIGRAVPFTSLSDDLGQVNVPESIQRELRKQLRLGLDTKAASEFKQAQVKYIPTGQSSGTFDTDGTASTQASANWNVFHGEEVYDFLYDDLAAPPLDNDDYVGIFRWAALRGLMRDPEWAEWHKYTDPQAKFNGEVGRMDRIRYIGTNHANAFGKVGSSNVLGEGVVFGEDAVVMAEVMTPELRMGIPQDLGRSRMIGWYGILNFKLIWDTANKGEARVIHVTSS